MSGRNRMRLGEELSGFNSLNLRDLMKEQDQDEIKEVSDEDVSQRQRQTIGSILGGLVSAKEEEKTEARTTLWEVIQSEQSEKPKEFTSGGILKNVRRLVARKKDEIKEVEEFDEEEETFRLLNSWGNNRSPRSPTIVDSARAVIDSERLLQDEEEDRLEGAVRVFLVGGSSHTTDRQMMDRPRWRALRHKLRLRKFACCGSSWSAARSNLSATTPVVLPDRDDDDEISWSGSHHRIESTHHQNNNSHNNSSTGDANGDDDDAETCAMVGPEADVIGETPTAFVPRVNFTSSSHHPDTETAETPSSIGAMRFNLGSLYRGGQTESAETPARSTFGMNSPYHRQTGGQTETVNQVLQQPRRERREQLITLLERTLEPEVAERQETRGSMNLAAALAAERQLRAVQEQESMASAGASGVSTHPQILTELQADIENREGSRSPFRVSLMTLLEEADDRNGTAAAVLPEEWDSKDEVAADNGGLGVDDSLCCVCMVRRKGAAFIPCGHTFCRLCTRELWVSRGSCPLCNRSIVEILDIF